MFLRHRCRRQSIHNSSKSTSKASKKGSDMHSGKKIIGIIAAASAALLSLAGCGNTNNSSSSAQVDTKTPVNLTVWTGNTTPTKAAAAIFEKKYPNVKIKVETVTDAYQALDTAIQAGSGIPDVMEFEYLTVPYFAIQNKLVDLSTLGANNDKGTFVKGAWQDISFNNKPYAIPMDYGPSVMFYNKAILEKAGVSKVPETWEEYYQAAKKVKALGDKYYITNDASDIFTLLSLVWQAGGHPFKVNGTTAHINVKDPKMQEAVSYYQKMIQEGLIATNIKTWSDDWNRALNDGTIATQIIGGWFTSSIKDRAPKQAGNFRVAPMPQWKAGEQLSAENGGSGFAIPAKAKNHQWAWKFLHFLAYDKEGVKARVDAGVFPPNVSVLKNNEFLSSTDPYFGDQKYREPIADSAQKVGEGWQYLPFMEKVRDLYGDNMDYAKVAKGESLQTQLENWAKLCIDYGNKQGFTVSK